MTSTDAMVVDVMDVDNEVAEMSTIAQQLTRVFSSKNNRAELMAVKCVRSFLRGTTYSCPMNRMPIDFSFKSNLDALLSTVDASAFSTVAIPAKQLITLGNAVFRVYEDGEESHWLSLIIQKFKGEEQTKEVLAFHRKLWNAMSERTLTEHLVLLFIQLVDVFPNIIEEQVMSLITSCSNVSNENVIINLKESFRNKDNELWLTLCSKSQKVFQISCNIINTLAIYSKGNPTVMKIAHTFQRTVRDICQSERRTISTLYPDNLQRLVESLDSPPSVRLSANDEVLDMLADCIVYDRVACLCLLTHFPEWLPYLVSFCLKNDEARIIFQCLAYHNS